MIVTISEDATRIIQRVEYDPNGDKCVGFVLPLDKCGVPINNTFLATSFQCRKILQK